MESLRQPMRKPLVIAAAALALTACSVRTPLSVEVVRSEMLRCPEASYIDGMKGSLKWNYTTGLELKAFIDVYSVCGQEDMLDYADAWYDAVIAPDGSIGGKYKLANYSTDHICPGRTLFQLYDITGKEKYRAAMDTLYRQLAGHPRTQEGNFWHKKVYPGQVWLDGLYMAQPFYAEYASRYLPDSLRQAAYSDITEQFELAFSHCFDPATGLLRHAWDSTGEMFWADPATGLSAHAWGRALGWYAMALVDVMEVFPQGELRDRLGLLLRRIYEALPRYSDPRTGLWYQVLDCPGREGNYLEATCSAMFVYAWLKGIRLGALGRGSRKAALQTYRSMLKTFVSTDEDGVVSLMNCCEVAGLGGKDNRSGDYEYYIHEPVRANDPKGIGPLIWAALEKERL